MYYQKRKERISAQIHPVNHHFDKLGFKKDFLLLCESFVNHH